MAGIRHGRRLNAEGERTGGPGVAATMSEGAISVDGMTSPAWDAGQLAVLALPVEASGTVVGAPGTGKTAVLVERVARLIDAGVAADELVVLTPTRVSATRLRDELGVRVAVLKQHDEHVVGAGARAVVRL